MDRRAATLVVNTKHQHVNIMWSACETSLAVFIVVVRVAVTVVIERKHI